MTGFFPKLACWLFGCSYWSEKYYQTDSLYTQYPLDHCRRCHKLKPIHKKALERALESNVKFREENRELKEKIKQYEKQL